MTFQDHLCHLCLYSVVLPFVLPSAHCTAGGKLRSSSFSRASRPYRGRGTNFRGRGRGNRNNSRSNSRSERIDIDEIREQLSKNLLNRVFQSYGSLSLCSDCQIPAFEAMKRGDECLGCYRRKILENLTNAYNKN